MRSQLRFGFIFRFSPNYGFIVFYSCLHKITQLRLYKIQNAVQVSANKVLLGRPQKYFFKLFMFLQVLMSSLLVIHFKFVEIFAKINDKGVQIASICGIPIFY